MMGSHINRDMPAEIENAPLTVQIATAIFVYHFVYPISRTLKKCFHANELGQDLGSRWCGREVLDTYRTHHQLIGISNINRLREWLALSTGSNCLPFCLP